MGVDAPGELVCGRDGWGALAEPAHRGLGTGQGYPGWVDHRLPTLVVVSSEVLRRESASLVARLRLWTPARWAAAAPDDAARPGTRADLAFHLAASFARAAGAPVRLPRLDSDLALPDQLAVTADDLARQDAGPVGVVDAVTHLLLHRGHLLGEQAPDGLIAELAALDQLDGGRPDDRAPDSSRPGGAALLRRARRVCGAAGTV